MNEQNSAIAGRTQAVQAWRSVLLALPDTAPRQLWLVDAGFAEWPLDDPAVLQALTQWIRLPGRRATWIAADFGLLTYRHPRLAAWRRDFAHGVDAFRPADGERIDWPSWLLADRGAVVLDDPVLWRGHNTDDPAEVRALRDAVDALLQRCEPAWPPTVLGL